MQTGSLTHAHPVNYWQAAVVGALSIALAPPLSRGQQIAITALAILGFTAAGKIASGRESMQLLDWMKSKIVSLYNQAQRTLTIVIGVEAWVALLDTFLEKQPPFPLLLKKSPLRDWTELVEGASKEIVREIAETHFAPGHILELGSHVLESGSSALATLLPPSYSKHLIYSDYKPEIVNSQLPKANGKRYLLVDATNFDAIKPLSQSTIVALNVVDTINRSLLPSVAKSAFRVVKPQGKVIVLADLFFDQTPLITKYTTATHIVLPHITKTSLGIKVIAKETLILYAKKQGDSFVQFVEKMLTLTPEQCFNYLLLTAHTPLPLGPILGQICPEDQYKVISNHAESFISDATEAFRDAGFAMICCEYIEKTKLESGTLAMHPEINSISVDLRNPEFHSERTVAHLPKGCLQRTSTFHLMVFQKK